MIAFHQLVTYLLHIPIGWYRLIIPAKYCSIVDIRSFMDFGGSGYADYSKYLLVSDLFYILIGLKSTCNEGRFVSCCKNSWCRHQMETFFRDISHFAGNLPVTGELPAQRPVSLMFSLICVWMIGWISNREAGDLRRHRAHYDVTVV